MRHAAQTAGFRGIPRPSLAGICAGLILLACAHGGFAQTAEVPPATPPGAQTQPVSPVEPVETTQSLAPKSGPFEAFGRWVDHSIANIKSGWARARGSADDLAEQAGDAAKEASNAAQEAARSVVRIPTTSVVSGRQHCARARNGGPDCRAATDTMCRAKGYERGRSVDIQSAQKCPAWVWLSGRQPEEGECTLETYVTRAVCQ